MVPNTFGIDATADRIVNVSTQEQLISLLRDPDFNSSPHLVVGCGSNMVFTRHFPSTVLHMVNQGVHRVDNGDSSDSLLVEAAAGTIWDDFVSHCIAHGWYGTENLAAIPGTVGAAPVQNVGAYGVEAKDIIHSVLAYEVGTGRPITLSCQECQFGYRDSIFKQSLANRCVVWSVTFRLSPHFSPNLSYSALSAALANDGITNPTARQMADTVARIRWSKLPRPEETGSAGSFFKNPVVSSETYEALHQRFPELVAHPTSQGYKLSAGWLIDRAGWKGRDLGRCGVYEKQALVLVNRGGCTGQEVLALADAITSDIKSKFSVTLEKEAIII